jgi:uncharacterized protein with GYD domain
MPKYLFQLSYSIEGFKILLKDGGTKRRELTEQVMKELGGSVEAYYFAFGDTDVYIISDAPDNVAAAVASLNVNAGGVVKLKTTVLLTPEEVDQATKMTLGSSPPSP